MHGAPPRHNSIYFYVSHFYGLFILALGSSLVVHLLSFDQEQWLQVVDFWVALHSDVIRLSQGLSFRTFE